MTYSFWWRAERCFYRRANYLITVPVVGLVLVFLATSNLIQLQNVPSIDRAEFFETCGSLQAVSLIELSTGVALVLTCMTVGRHFHVVKLLGTVLLLSLCVISLGMVMAGVPECASIATVSIRPIIMLALQVLAAVVLVSAKTPGRRGSPFDQHQHLSFWNGGLLLFIPILAAAAVSNESKRVDLSKVYASMREKTQDVGQSPPPPEFPDFLNYRRGQFVESVACGPFALLSILASLDVDVDGESIRRVIDAAGSTGMTFAEIQNLAKSFDVYSVGVELSPSDLRKTGMPAIVRFGSATFVAVTWSGFAGTEVIFPGFRREILSNRVFHSECGGGVRALIFSAQPIKSVLGYDVEKLVAQKKTTRTNYDAKRVTLRPDVIAIGRIRQPRFQGHILLSNNGAESITIDSVIPSCSCMVAKVDTKVIQPGGSTTLSVDGTQDTLGRFAYSIALATKDRGETTLRKIPVRGLREPPVCTQAPGLVVNDIKIGEELNEFVPLIIPPDIDAHTLVVDIDESCHLSATVSSSPGPPGLRLHWHGTAPPGWHRFRLSVHCKDSPEAVLGDFRIAIQVTERVTAEPSMLFVPQSELGTQWTRTVAFRVKDDNRDGLANAVRYVRLEPAELGSRVSIRVKESSKTLVTAEIVGASSSHSLRGSIGRVALYDGSVRIGSATLLFGAPL